MSALKKTGKVLLYIVGGILLLLIIVSILIDPIAKRLLENQVAKAGEGQYTLFLDDVDISIIRGTARLEGVRFKTDTIENEKPPIAFLDADEIAVEGVSWLTYLLENKLLTDRVLLDNIDATVYARTTEKAKKTEEEQKPFRIEQLDIYPAIKQQVDRVRLKDLRFSEIAFTLVNVGTQDTLSMNAGELNLQSDDILLDTDKLITENRAFYSTDIDFKSQGLEIRRSGNKILQAEVEVFVFTTEEELMGIRVEDLAFLERDLQQRDTLMFAEFQEFIMSELDMLKVQKENTAQLKKISLTGLNVVNMAGASQPSSATGTTSDTTQNQQSLNLARLSLGEQLPAPIERVKLEELDINKVDYRQGDSIRVENANLHASEIVINDSSAFAENRFLHTSTLEANVELMAATMGEDPKFQLRLAGFTMDVEEGLGSIGFKDLQVETKEKQEKEMWVEAEIGSFKLVSLDTRKLPQGILSIDSIAIADPLVLAHLPAEQGQGQQGQQSQQQSFTPPNFYPAIEGVLDKFILGKLAIIGADIKVEGIAGSKQAARIPALYLQVSDIVVAEGTAYAGNRVLHSADIALRVEDILFPLPGGLYTAKLDLFRLSTREQFVEALEFLLDHPGGPGEIPSGADTATVFQVENDVFRINELDWQRLIEKQEVSAGLIFSKGLDAYAYVNNNKAQPQPKQEKQAKQDSVQPMPQKAIRQIKTPFYIRKFKMEDASLVYEVLAAEADTSGIATISDVDVSLANMTNIPARLRENSKIPLEFNGKLMGTGDFRTQIVLYMASDSSLVTVSGQLDTMDITKMNRFTEYISRIGFESGKIYEVGWDFHVDEEKAEGTVEMSYDNLMIEISEKTSPEASGILKEAGTFLANNLVLESDLAPKKSEKPEEAEFSEERDPKESFPAYVLQGLISGFVELLVTIF